MNSVASCYAIGPLLSTSNDRLDDLAVYVGKATLAAVVVVGQLLVVETEKAEHGGVEVVDRRDVLLRFVAEGIGGAVARAGLHAGAGQPGGEAERIVVPAF